ncbi:preprotein translocase subunit SecE [Egicoccus sp. AB-alg6-2]|uniref:preprotein translocase subunit SecE n=1 Tax=Egicoccus sp. AB-alg6-2 TaxID=3242692 RepID=UPI00359CC641
MSRESKRNAGREQRRTAGQASAADEAPRSEGRTPPAQFLREVRSELRKVAWPNRKEVTSYTIVVLVVTLVLVLLVWGMDYIFRNAVINTLG